LDPSRLPSKRLFERNFSRKKNSTAYRLPPPDNVHFEQKFFWQEKFGCYCHRRNVSPERNFPTRKTQPPTAYHLPTPNNVRLERNFSGKKSSAATAAAVCRFSAEEKTGEGRKISAEA
jgi:hypothetical protein